MILFVYLYLFKTFCLFALFCIQKIDEEIDFDALDYFDVKERPYNTENSYLHNSLYLNPNNRKDIKLVDNDTIMYNTIGFRTLIYKKEK